MVKERSQSFTGKYRIQGKKLTLVLASGETVVGSIANGAMIDPEGEKLVKQ